MTHSEREVSYTLSKDADPSLAYWRDTLADAPALVDVPTDWPRLSGASPRLQALPCKVDPSLMGHLAGVCEQEKVPLSVVLLAGFGIVLARLAGQSDLIIATDKLPLRLDLSGDPTFRELLKRLDTVWRGAQSHADVTFERVAKEIGRDDARTLFQVSFRMEGQSDSEVSQKNSPSELVLAAQATGGEIKFTFTYNAGIFDQDRVACMAEQVLEVLSRAAKGPDEKIGGWSLVTAQARSVVPDPSSALDEPPQEAVVDTIARWAQSTPNACAIEGRGLSCTFAELDARRRAIAAALLELGVKPGSRVVVTGPRTVGLIAAFLGVWSSGGVVVPIADDLPEARKRVMAEQAEATFCVLAGPERLAWSLPKVRVAAESGSLLGESGTASSSATLPRISGDDPAYVFFTSGTTGTPKGVLGTHKGVAHFLKWQRETFKVGPSDRAAQLTGLTFNVVLRDIFTPLTAGATLCLPPREMEALDGIALLAWFREARITIVHSVPSVLDAWFGQAGSVEPLTRLRLIFLAGEALTDAVVHQCRTWLPNCRVIHVYGQTESTLAKCYSEVPFEPLPGRQPVGRPLPQAQVLLLNDAGLVCGVGEPGEVVVRTPFCTLGYVNDPERTATRFRKNPFRDDPRDIVYYTGDRGRYRPDGQLTILGRADDQVKVNGVRVEPSEVAAVLRAHPSVSAAFVRGFTQAPGRIALCAYIVSAPGVADEAAATLREYLIDRLPQAMIPAVFVPLESMPLLANGKVNRLALPDPLLLERQYVAPSTPTEQRLARIWCDVLDVDQVGVDDDFFEIGGHSILVIQAARRIDEEFNVDIGIRVMFEAPTLRELAQHIDANGAVEARSAGIVRVPRSGDLPLSYEEEVLWRWERAHPGTPGWNGMHSFYLLGALDRAALERALSGVMRRHEALRTGFATVGDQPMRTISDVYTMPLEVVDLQALDPDAQKQEVNAYAEREWSRTFDLVHGPMIRASLLKLGSDKHVLILNTPHLAVGGVGRQVIVRDMIALYAAEVGVGEPLPDLSVQMADYAVWQRESVNGAEMRHRLAFWHQQLSGAEPIRLPQSRPTPAVRSLAAFETPFQVSSLTLQGLKELAAQQSTTLFVVHAAAFEVLLHRQTKQDNFVIAAPLATHENTAGLRDIASTFTDHILVRAGLSGNPSFRDLVARVRVATATAFANATPLQLVLDGATSPMDHPLMRVVINHHSASYGVAEWTAGPVVFRAFILPPTPLVRKFDVIVAIGSEGSKGTFITASDIFDGARVASLASDYMRLLESLASKPDQLIGDNLVS